MLESEARRTLSSVTCDLDLDQIDLSLPWMMAPGTKSFNIDIKPSYFSKLEPLEVHKLLDMDWKMLSLIIHTVSLINPSVLPVDWLYQKEAIIISFLNIMKPINVNVNHSHVIYVTKFVDGSLN